MQDAVAARSSADVPLGVLLSGGIDSAVIAAEMVAAAGDGRAVRTFTAAIGRGSFDESRDAERTARMLGTDHRTLRLADPDDDLVRPVLAQYDQPFADSSALPTYLICRAAREHVKVALVGDGGDEAFGGYDRYRALRLSQRLSVAGFMCARVAGALARPWAPLEERSRLRRLVRFADALGEPPAGQYFRYRALFSAADLRRLLTEDFLTAVDAEAPYRWFTEIYERGDWGDEVARAQQHDMLSYLPDDLLVKADRASMSCSLELRAPFLDPEVASLGLSMPAGWKVSRRRGKVILREAFRGRLPRSVLRGRKRGFGVPLGDWLRGPLRAMVTETLLDRGFLEAGIVRREAVQGLLNDHMSGRDDHRHRIWALFVLADWLSRR